MAIIYDSPADRGFVDNNRASSSNLHVVFWTITAGTAAF